MIDILVYGMVYAGSLLMVYNIFRYVQFERHILEKGGWGQQLNTLKVPIVLLVMFLLGYLAVGIFGKPDMVVAAILFGGSIFVLLMILFLQHVTDRIQENERLKAELQSSEESNRAKTNFLSTMSHEMRTPLSAIIGLDSVMLKQPGLDEGMRDKLEGIDSNARHLLGIIDDILDMSLADAGKLTLNRAPFDLRAVLKRMSTGIEGRCIEKGIAYSCVIDESVGTRYEGDADKVEQILSNILDNAVKFTEASGSIELRANRTAVADGVHALQFTIADTGVGIDEDFLPSIFDIFAQEDEAISRWHGGSGLGLALAKRNADLMDGSIDVSSTKGVGTTVTVTLALSPCEDADEVADDDGATRPIAAIQSDDAGDAQSDDAAPDAQPDQATQVAEAAAHDQVVAEDVDLTGLRLLLVEDVQINAEILADLLDMEDMISEHAENGKVALEMFERSEIGWYDAVLMDMRMPVMDGLEATRAIRALDRPDAKTVPIIALTANAFEEDARKFMEAGANAHLPKPADPDVLCETLGNLVSR